MRIRIDETVDGEINVKNHTFIPQENDETYIFEINIDDILIKTELIAWVQSGELDDENERLTAKQWRNESRYGFFYKNIPEAVLECLKKELYKKIDLAIEGLK